MKVSKNFILQEFVPKSVFNRFGANSMWFIDTRIIEVAQFFRDRYNLPITINDWYKGGKRTLSGFRPPTSKVGASLSQHKFGRAADLKWLNQNTITIDEIREDIRKNQRLFRDIGLTAVEEGTDTWLHIDIRDAVMDFDKILFIGFWNKK